MSELRIYIFVTILLQCLLGSDLSYVVFCWGLSVSVRNGRGCLGFAREVLVGPPVWCVSVLVCSVSVLCL